MDILIYTTSGYGEGVLKNVFAEAREFTEQKEDVAVGAIIHLKDVETIGNCHIQMESDPIIRQL